MSWSLQLISGDLSLSGPGGLATVDDSAKLVQDLKNWLLEPRGTDPSHPDYGSTLDGGVLSDGSYSSSAIGNVISDYYVMVVEAEIRRILLAYQQQQIDRLNRETILYAGKNTFGTNELLSSIEDISLTQISTTVVAVITIGTSSGNQLTFTQPVV